MADGYELDIDPKTEQARLLDLDRRFRDDVAQMGKGERETLIETIQEMTGYSRGHILRTINPNYEKGDSQWRTLFSYKGKSDIPAGTQLPRGATQRDAFFNAKVRFGEAVVRGVEAGGASSNVSEGIKGGEVTRDFGNSVTGLNEDRLLKYLWTTNLQTPSIEFRLQFQAGGGVYAQYWHDSPQSSGSTESDFGYANDLFDPNEGWY
jgi:hypothetical protein